MTSILITGGTGFIGHELVRHYLATPIQRIIVLSRDEYKQSVMAKTFPDPRIRWFLGDVRDLERLTMACHRVEVIIHAAALKRVDRVAYDPSEVIKTNVLGTQNVIHAAIQAGVQKVLLISSDKAVEPTNIYGASKMCAEWLAVQSNAYAYPRGTRVAVVRYGNVIGSRGSVVQLWQDAVAQGKPLRITHESCTRFWIRPQHAITLITDTLDLMDGGEIVVPALASMRLVDLAEAIAPGHPREIVGLRPGGEKFHEKLLNADEITRTVRVRGHWVVEPAIRYWGGIGLPQTERPPADWVYSSDRNTRWLSVEEMRGLLDPTP